MNYRVKPGKEAVFERAFESVLEAMGKSTGHTRSHLYSEVGKPGTYLILSEWSDRAAFDAFVKSDAFAKVTAWGREQILLERPSHHVYVGP
jgi:heme-degrading monooxygenase HmoA